MESGLSNRLRLSFKTSSWAAVKLSNVHSFSIIYTDVHPRDLLQNSTTSILPFLKYPTLQQEIMTHDYGRKRKFCLIEEGFGSFLVTMQEEIRQKKCCHASRAGYRQLACFFIKTKTLSKRARPGGYMPEASLPKCKRKNSP